MAASFPGSAKVFTTKTNNVDDVDASHINDLQDEVFAIETQLVGQVFRTTPLTSTAYDGDAFSTTAKTLIDLSTVFGVPANVRAVYARVSVLDSASAGGDYYVVLSPNNTAGNGLIFGAHAVNGRYARGAAIIPCDANGDIYIQVVASGAGTMNIIIQIWAYWL